MTAGRIIDTAETQRNIICLLQIIKIEIRATQTKIQHYCVPILSNSTPLTQRLCLSLIWCSTKPYYTYFPTLVIAVKSATVGFAGMKNGVNVEICLCCLREAVIPCVRHY